MIHNSLEAYFKSAAPAKASPAPTDAPVDPIEAALVNAGAIAGPVETPEAATAPTPVLHRDAAAGASTPAAVAADKITTALRDAGLITDGS